ncbi:PH domain-containing protein [Tardisphaera miroshnichenkoae]
METLQFRPTLRAYLVRFVLVSVVFVLIMGAALFYRQVLLSLRDGLYLLLMLLGLDVIFLAAEALPPLVYVRSRSYSVGNGKVEAKVGVFSRSVRAISIPQIREIEVRQGAMGRLMGYGDVRVLSGLGASEDIFMKAVRDPMRVKSLIEELMGHGPASGETAQEKNEK